MRKKRACILDFGTSAITVLAGENNVNNNFRILGSGQADYAGFMDGEFVEPNALKSAIMDAISKAQEGLGNRIKSLYIGVPSDFCVIHEDEIEMSFGKRVKITDKHLDSLFSRVDTKQESEGMLISVSPMYYVLDDGNKVLNAVNSYSKNIKARVSLVFVENKFVHLISSIMHECGDIDFELVCSMLAENMYLLSPGERAKGAVLVDCGYITTSVSLVVGDGLCDLSSFSDGGGFITGELSNQMGLSFAEAEQLKRKMILSLDATSIDSYEIYRGEDVVKVPAKKANDIVLGCVDAIVSSIKACMQSFTQEYIDDNSPIFITGGGLNYLKGIKGYLSQALDRNIEFVKPKALQYRRPELSSDFSLLEFALKLS